MFTRRKSNAEVVDFDELVAQRYATASMEWIDEQLTESQLDHKKVLNSVQQVLRKAGNGSRRRMMWMQVAAMMAIVAVAPVLGPDSGVLTVEMRRVQFEPRGSKTAHKPMVLARAEPLIRIGPPAPPRVAPRASDPPHLQEITEPPAGASIPIKTPPHPDVAVCAEDEVEQVAENETVPEGVLPELRRSVTTSLALRPLAGDDLTELIAQLKRDLAMANGRTTCMAMASAARVRPDVRELASAFFKPKFRTIRIQAASGTAIVAVADGIVSYMGELPKGGKNLWLQTENGAAYHYGRIGRWSPGLYEGMEVKAGDILGYVEGADYLFAAVDEPGDSEIVVPSNGTIALRHCPPDGQLQ